MLALLLKKLMAKMKEQRESAGRGEVGIPLEGGGIDQSPLDPLYHGPIGTQPLEERETYSEGGEPVMEEIVVKAKAPPRDVIRRNRRKDFWENAGSKVWEGAKLVSNPASYIGGKLLSEYMRSQRNKDDTSGVGEAETGEPEERKGMQVGGPTEEQMSELMPEEGALIAEMEEEPTHMMPDGTEMPGATHNESQIPDEEMESDYLDFVIGEALTPEDEQYLFDKLNEDDQLSMIFDKVVETASEFSGSGTVEGPGSNVSDSIPARLSDGEFVITSKASNQIGPEVLQELMELAEQEADGEVRQTANTGGLAQTEGTAIVAGASEDERGLAMKNKEAMRLLDPRLSLFAS